LVAIASVLLLSGTAAYAASWPDLKAVDTDGNGQIDRVEWQKNAGNLKLDWLPNFAAMDMDSNNVVDEDEWAAAEKTAASYTARCREASASWCKDAK
jgi:hypothetical protein